MGTKGNDLAAEFEATNQRLITTIESMTEADWKRPCAGETWPAGVTAHHAAESIGPLSGIVQAMASGGPVPPITPEALDAMNAQHAQREANCTREQTLQLLRTGGEEAVRTLRAIPDDGFARTAVFGPMGETSAENFAKAVLIGHLQAHGSSVAAVKAS
ncbi:MAG TPA: DinB family protein [Tepidiformaceae bacterium]|nr:DinB family protein [Tepidiformaceae bacterium]